MHLRSQLQHRLWACLDHLSSVWMAAFQSYLQSGKRRKAGWVGTTVMLFLVTKKCLVKKGVWNGLLSWYASTIICCCITLLQLLYRGQNQSRKLWIDVSRRLLPSKDFFLLPNIFALCREAFSKWCVGKWGRVEECSVAPLRNKRVKTLCGCRRKKGTN
jgi:hypothetical protein